MALDELIEQIKKADKKLGFTGNQLQSFTFTEIANVLVHTPETVKQMSFRCEVLEGITSEQLGDILAALPNIHFLDLSANGLFLIDGIENALKKLKPSIKYLFLSENDLGNKLDQIEDEHKLEWLKGIFTSFENLEHLCLSNNNLNIIPGSSISVGFQYLSENLKSLKLSFNEITGDVFEGLPKSLVSIDLSNDSLYLLSEPDAALPDATKYLPANVKRLLFENNFPSEKPNQLLTIFKDLPSTLNQIYMGPRFASCSLNSELAKTISSNYIQELDEDEREPMRKNLKAGEALIPGLFFNFSKYELARSNGFDNKRIQHSAKHFEEVIPSNMKFNSELAIKDIFEYNVAKFLTPKDASNLAIARGKPRSILNKQ